MSMASQYGVVKAVSTICQQIEMPYLEWTSGNPAQEKGPTRLAKWAAACMRRLAKEIGSMDGIPASPMSDSEAMELHLGYHSGIEKQTVSQDNGNANTENLEVNNNKGVLV
jgi:hypothetical protein